MPSLNAQQKDLYEVLGIDRGATAEQIKTAYRKAALKLHPDKNTGTSQEEAALKFQEVSAAYGILSDPHKRQKYDLQGFAAVAASDLEVPTVDVTSLNLFSTVAASLFTNLGVHVRTSLPLKILETAASGSFQSNSLQLGQSVEGKIDKAQAIFYELPINRQEVEEGFILGAYSTAGHRIKLLLFEPVGSRSWEIQEQEDSIPTHNGTTLAALFLSSERTYVIRPTAGGPEVKLNVETQLFQRLDNMIPREHIRVQPGNILVAVYNDNWFKKANFKLTAVSPASAEAKSNALSEVKQQEAKLVDMQSTIHKFQTEYTKAQEEWRRASQKFDALKSDTNDALRQRDDAYLKLVGAPHTSSPAPKPRISVSWGNAS